ncbi:MAG: hypothetical protein GX142_05995 [Chloroflexi bacterium]|nr:hypothetical protein [Chloroflexota bacterium]
MLKPNVTCIGKIKNIQDREDLILITDSLEVEHIIKDSEYLGTDEDQIEFTGLFVLLADSDYREVYGFEGCAPYLNMDLWRININ